jgi:hypothetical protein
MNAGEFTPVSNLRPRRLNPIGFHASRSACRTARLRRPGGSRPMPSTTFCQDAGSRDSWTSLNYLDKFHRTGSSQNVRVGGMFVHWVNIIMEGACNSRRTALEGRRAEANGLAPTSRRQNGQFLQPPPHCCNKHGQSTPQGRWLAGRGRRGVWVRIRPTRRRSPPTDADAEESARHWIAFVRPVPREVRLCALLKRYRPNQQYKLSQSAVT